MYTTDNHAYLPSTAHEHTLLIYITEVACDNKKIVLQAVGVCLSEISKV
jgi:hypothetical protein